MGIYSFSVWKYIQMCKFAYSTFSCPDPSKWPCVGFGVLFSNGSHYVSEASLEFCPASISQLLGLWVCTTMLGFISFCLRQGRVGFVLQSLPQSLEWHRTQQGLAFDSLYMCSFLFGIQAPNFNNQRLKYKSL